MSNMVLRDASASKKVLSLMLVNLVLYLVTVYYLVR